MIKIQGSLIAKREFHLIFAIASTRLAKEEKAWYAFSSFLLLRFFMKTRRIGFGLVNLIFGISIFIVNEVVTDFSFLFFFFFFLLDVLLM